MGEVYRARDPRLGRDVALKILPAEFARDSSRRARFEQEARVVAALSHPNIVAVYDVGDGYIVSELVDGETLRAANLGLRKTLDVAEQIAGGLSAAHAAGIVHRDLKPDNVLVTKEGRAKILDFGLARIRQNVAAATGETRTATVRTEPGVVMGTVAYMSPEQVRGLEADHRSDIFSFGVMLHEMLSGSRPFQGETSVEIMTAILKHETPELPESVPAPVRAIVEHCLEKDAANRFQSAKDLGFAVAQSTRRSAASSAIPGRRLSRLWWPAIALAGTAFGIAAGMFIRPAPPAAVWKGTWMGGPDFVLYPQLSRDGRMVAFSAMVGAQSQVGVMKPESGNWTVLTRDADHGFVASTSWSPDGARIYYDRNAENPKGVFSVPVLGGDEHLVLENAAQPEALADGSLLVTRLNSERKNQIFHFWPETGKLQGYPMEVRIWSRQYRAFPDGRDAAVIGARIGAGEEGEHLYLLNLESGAVRRLSSGVKEERWAAVAVTQDGRAVIAAAVTGNSANIVQIARDGGAPAHVVLHLTHVPEGVDSGPDGSLYLEQNEGEGSLLKLPSGGGAAEKFSSARTAAALMDSLVLLPDGRVAGTMPLAGITRLVVIEKGKDPTPLIQTPEETSTPAARLGAGDIAFLIGPEPRRTIAVASIATGRITRRIRLDKGVITSIAPSLDGRTLYTSAGGMVWNLPLEGGEPVQIHAADSAILEPSGDSLLVQLVEPSRTRLVRVSLRGGADREIPIEGPFRLPGYPLSAAMMGKDGRLLTPVVTDSAWCYPPGMLDLTTGRLTRLASDVDGDYHAMSWAPDGRILTWVMPPRRDLWKFTPVLPAK
jgi:eukaryotic-like serine/threonine-protein kinase